MREKSLIHNFGFWFIGGCGPSHDGLHLLYMFDTDGNRRLNPSDSIRQMNPSDGNRRLNPSDSIRQMNPSDGNRRLNPQDSHVYSTGNCVLMFDPDRGRIVGISADFYKYVMPVASGNSEGMCFI
jgi:hypothetical protein